MIIVRVVVSVRNFVFLLRIGFARRWKEKFQFFDGGLG